MVLRLLVSVLLLTGCGAGPTLIQGRVVDQSGLPMGKAEIETSPQTDLAVSNSRGFFVLQKRINDQGEAEPIVAGVYHVQVRKFGFEPVSFEVHAEGGRVKVADVVMQPRTLDVGDAPPSVTVEPKLGADDGSTPVSGP
jgi:hypothetical protein